LIRDGRGAERNANHRLENARSLLRDIGGFPGDRPANPIIIFCPHGTVLYGMNSCFPIIVFVFVEELASKAAITVEENLGF
jgi:hypothetical protein